MPRELTEGAGEGHQPAGRAGSTGRAPTRTPVAPQGVLAIQRSAGNRAVASILSGGAKSERIQVQRLLATKASDIDRLISTSNTIKGAMGAKTSDKTKALQRISKAIGEYQRTIKTRGQDLASVEERLFALNDLCAEFIVANRDDPSRLRVVGRLQQQVESELASVGKDRGMAAYQRGFTSSAGGFQALEPTSMMGATDHNTEVPDPRWKGPKRPERIRQAREKHGLTAAHISAITTYSGGDYNYMNPVMANNAGWLTGAKGKNPNSAFGRVDNQTLRDEGGIHGAVALDGLKKMQPYKGTVYRGARFTPEEFGHHFKVGEPFNYGTLTSSSKDQSRALDFAFSMKSAPDEKQTVGILTEIEDSGGRDISEISMFMEEAEVLILPDTTLVVVSIEKVDGPRDYPDHADRATKSKRPLPTTFYVIKMRVSSEPSTRSMGAPPPKKPKWAGAGASSQNDLSAVPQDVTMLGRERARAKGFGV